MGPLIKNLIFSLSTILYIIIGVSLFDLLVRRGMISKNISRKFIHIRVANRILFLYFGDLTHRSKRLREIPPGVFIIAFLIKSRAPPEDPFVRSMSRSGDPKELLGGTFHYVVMTALLLFLLLMRASLLPRFLLAIIALGFGDGIAALTGGYGRIGSRSLSGSLGFFFSTIIVSILYFTLFGIAIDEWLDKIIIASFIASLVEIITPSGYDNITIPLAVISLAFL